MSNINGYNEIILLDNSKIYLFSGKIENCSAQNFTIFKIYNSSFYLEDIKFYNINSSLLYSSLGVIRINNCFFDNFYAGSSESEFVLKLENEVSFFIKNSTFQNLKNFEKVIYFKK